METVLENWQLLKAAMAAFVGWGFGFAIGIIVAVVIAIKDNILDWYEDHRRSDD